ncbi:hypothetical protein LSAT2_009005 [Lamellibrachia satsuma]|nr:hypothetical protein LSAT2_009005 [Lamellibrachia satsuma]
MALWRPLSMMGKFVDSISQGDRCGVLVDKTCFYAENWGQKSDSGQITTCEKYVLHIGLVQQGTFTVGDKVTLATDKVYPTSVHVVSLGVSVNELLADPKRELGLQQSVELCGGTHLGALVVTNFLGMTQGRKRVIAVTGAWWTSTGQKRALWVEEVQAIEKMNTVLATKNLIWHWCCWRHLVTTRSRRSSRVSLPQNFSHQITTTEVGAHMCSAVANGNHRPPKGKYANNSNIEIVTFSGEDLL